ncbi:MAG TPA: lipopolysaccharide heptosyltransferase II [Elusimicrobia bacterium]|jgi:heptosyltransferase-2|nr:lipopolysaccharide heptosyltransferase II [Elusimicrobiota bacterium]
MKILIIRLSSLGDLVLTTPVYQNLKQLFPEARITLLVKKEFVPLFENNPYLDEIIPFEQDKGLLFYIRMINAGKYDLLIDLHNNLRSNLIRFFSKVKKKIKYNKAIRARYLLVYGKKRTEELKKHTVERYLDVLNQLTVKAGLRVFIIQTAYLGDAVLTTLLLRETKENFPDALLTVLSTPEIKEIFAQSPEVNNLIVYDKRNKEKGLLPFFRLVKKIKKENFDLAILPHRSFRSALLVWLAGIPRRIGFISSEGKIFLTDLVPFDWRIHDAERNLELLKPLGVKRLGHSGELSISVDENTKMEFLHEYNLDEKDLIVGINPGSVWPTKRWLPERFAEVIDLLIERDKVKVIIFGGKEDTGSTEEIEKKVHYPIINLAGKTNLKELIALISGCNIFLTNDSGPMHIAVASKVPTVAIFGPTTKELGFYPYGEEHRIVEVDLPCRPCSLHGGKKCPLGHFNCMRMISAEQVYSTVKEVLRTKNAYK